MNDLVLQCSVRQAEAQGEFSVAFSSNNIIYACYIQNNVCITRLVSGNLFWGENSLNPKSKHIRTVAYIACI